MASTPPSAPYESELSIQGMSCQNCVRHAREAIVSHPAVLGTTVELEPGRASIRWQDEESADPQEVISLIEQAGFTAQVASRRSSEQTNITPWYREWKTSVLVAAFAFLFFVAAEWLFDWHQAPAFRWIAFAVGTLVQAYCGSRFYAGAWRQLKQGQSNMDTLVSLGSTAAYAYSAWVLFSGSNGPLYFMDSVGIIAFVSLGHYIESHVAQKASGALESLLNLTPETACRLNASRQKTTVAVSDLKSGDTIVVAPGEQIPVDGSVAQGHSTCDESMLTGESNPIEKPQGSSVLAGTLNLSGQLTIEVTGTGKETALARIIAVVERAQNSRADVQRLADRISSIFVPIVVGIALLSGLAWFLIPSVCTALHQALSPFLWSPSLPTSALAAGIIHSVAVLIVACPCAMGLATPIAIMAGTNAAAKQGVLIRDGQALERSGSITHLLFDKTGTLTLGRPQVINLQWADSSLEDNGEGARILQAMTQGSKHPLSRAIATHLPNATQDIELASWQEHPGKGVECSLTTPSQLAGTWRLGSPAWLSSVGVERLSPDHTASTPSATLIGLAKNETWIASIELRDQVKHDADRIVRDLQAQGLAVGMVSGDRQETAEAIGSELGISAPEIHAEISPEGKARLIEQLQQKGAQVCFVGDGINDAPALEKADLGIAVRFASDIAKESADIVLLQSDIQAIPKALNMARATLLTIKQNLFWAFFYNTVGIPLAALGFLNPLLCAAAMGFSDLIVVGNALRLRFRRF